MSCCLFPFLDDYFSANLFPTINCHTARKVSPEVIFLSFNFLSVLYLFAQFMKTPVSDIKPRHATMSPRVPRSWHWHHTGVSGPAALLRLSRSECESRVESGDQCTMGNHVGPGRHSFWRLKQVVLWIFGAFSSTGWQKSWHLEACILPINSQAGHPWA